MRIGLTKECIVSLALVSVCAQPGYGRDVCDTYASQAFRAAVKNTAENCGFEGARWRVDVNYHLKWCAGATQNDRAFETRLRGFHLEQCAAAPNDPCNIYAQAAVERGRMNRELQCGFTQGRFVATYQDQYDWCYKVSAQVVAKANRASNEMIELCRAAKN